MRVSGVRIAVPIVTCLLCAEVSAQVTQRVSIATDGAQGNAESGLVAVSPTGRFVVFGSLAYNLVPGDTNASGDVFVRDRQQGTTERVSVDSNGVQGNSLSGIEGVSISDDGRFVVFDSLANNLVPQDTNTTEDIFIHDRQTALTERVSVNSNGEQGNQSSFAPVMSSDGRFVAFNSFATNLVPNDTNTFEEVFLRDRQTGTTERICVDSNGQQADRDSSVVSISADGRYVAFFSLATNLVPGDSNNRADVFVRDRQLGTTEMVSIATSGAQGNRDSTGGSLSFDGRFVAFSSVSTNLVPGDTNGHTDVFIRDRQNGTTERCSVDSKEVQANGDSYDCHLSRDGWVVAFVSAATDLVAGDTNGFTDIYVHDRRNGATERVSVASSGVQGDSLSATPSISADGRMIAFASASTNLVPGDTNNWIDVFVHDRQASAFTSVCGPGTDGVIPCPCSNPGDDSGRGCNNSAVTGGAMLLASGVAYLSIDSLVFTTGGETPTALSVVMQGDSVIPSGVVYGQAVRCLGGPLIRRLFIKQALLGSITAPDFSAGDPTVSARSAAKGDVIQPGESRWYLVYYRDPTVLGGCPASSTFNATQTGRVDWSL